MPFLSVFRMGLFLQLGSEDLLPVVPVKKPLGDFRLRYFDPGPAVAANIPQVAYCSNGF
jgi:hypothetical protein